MSNSRILHLNTNLKSELRCIVITFVSFNIWKFSDERKKTYLK